MLEANVTAVGRFCATSSEKHGPDNILIFLLLAVLLTTSLNKSDVEISIPLEATIISWSLLVKDKFVNTSLMV